MKRNHSVFEGKGKNSRGRSAFDRKKKGSWIGKLLLILILLLLGACITTVVVKQILPGSERKPAQEAAVKPVETETAAWETEAETENADDSDSRIERTVEGLLESMSTYEKVCQLFVVTPEQLTDWNGTVTRAGETTKNAIQKRPVGGIIYMENNLKDREQTKEMLSTIQTYSYIPLFLAVDEEGGRVTRVSSNKQMGMTSIPAMGEVKDTEEAEWYGKLLGKELSDLGFNLDFAPVADLNENPDNPVIGDRAFSGDADEVAAKVAAITEGMKSQGLGTTLKHFPGHGNTTTDSHLEAAVNESSLEEMRGDEWVPFQEGIESGADLVMAGHISTPNVTGDQEPASLSKTMITDCLREELGFEGIIITDAMNMKAVTSLYDSGTAAVKAIKAGVDMILMPEDLEAALEGVTAAVKSGEITEEELDSHVRRILTKKLSMELGGIYGK